jgi:hypothetical protein
VKPKHILRLCLHGDLLEAEEGVAPPHLHVVLGDSGRDGAHLRQNFLSNRVFANYDAILDACCDARNALMALPDRIRSITQRDRAKSVST